MTTEAQTLTLPGAPVTRAVSWDMVRAYLRAEGWAPRTVAGHRAERWNQAGNEWPIWTGTDRIGDVVSYLARLVSVSPGEMLARIADGPDACRCPVIQAADPLRHFTGCPRREPLPEGHPNAAWALSLRADLANATESARIDAGLAGDLRAVKMLGELERGAAERMQEACADLIEAAAKVRDAGEEYGKTTRNVFLAEVCKAEARALRNVGHQVRALPSPTSQPPAADVPARVLEVLRIAEDIARERVEGAATGACGDALRAHAQGMRDVCFPLRVALGLSKVADLPASLHVPGCTRVATEGAGHPGACREKP